MDELRFEKGILYKAYTCPSCGAKDQLDVIDGDLAYKASDDQFSFFAMLHLFQCGECHGDFYFIDVYSVDNPEVSEDWIHKYLSGWGEVEEPSENVTVYYSGNVHSLPPLWLEKYTDTPEGQLTRFFLGPYVPSSQLYGPNGVSCCMDQPEWAFAARLVDDLLSVRIPTRKKLEDDGDSGEEVAH